MARDINEVAAKVVSIAVGQEPKQKDEAAVSLGRRGGLKGGRARAERLTEEQRRQIAQNAAKARWKRAKEK